LASDHPERPYLHATILEQEDKELQNLGLQSQKIFNCSIVLATLHDAIRRPWSKKIAFVSDKIKRGFLLILQLDTTAPNTEPSPFLLKTVVVRGIFFDSSMLS
jgi:hypothetical protein